MDGKPAPDRATVVQREIALLAYLRPRFGDDIDPDTPLVSSGRMTSMDVTAFEVWAERTFGGQFDLLTVNTADTIQQLAQIMARWPIPPTGVLHSPLEGD